VSHFYEFIPVEAGQAESPRTLLAHELEEGASYVIVLTTSGGLYRYNIGDVVRVVGFMDEAPMLEFLNKGSGFSSVTGEKVSEFQVVQAAREASPADGTVVDTFMAVPEWGGPPHYSVLVEEGTLGEASEVGFADRFDEALQRLNLEYESKRKTNRLGPVSFRRLSKGTWERYKEFKIRRNHGRIEQYKHVYLVQDFEFAKKLAKDTGVAVGEPIFSARGGGER